MAEPFLSEIKIMSFGFPPKGWALCNGQLLPINQNQALFSLLGTIYGGDGRVNFALPNLQGRVPMHMGDGHVLGERGGEQGHTLVINELAAHNHSLKALAVAADGGIPGRTPDTTKALAEAHAAKGGAQPVNLYGTGGPDRSFAPQAVTNVGGSQAHLNMQPFLTLNFCIALQGIFPSQT